MLSAYSVFFYSLLSTVFLPLCSGFVEVLLVLAVPLVAAKRRTSRGTLLLCFFFPVFSSSSSRILLCFIHSPPYSLPSLSFSLRFSFLSLFSSLLMFTLSLFFFFSFLSLCVFPLFPRFLFARAPAPPSLSLPPFWCGPSFGFIVRGRRRFLVTVSMHHDGVKHAPQTETTPLIALIHCRNRCG